MDKNGILIALSELELTKFGRQEFFEQSVPQKTFTAIWDVEAQVNNGGFSQYFANSSTESASFVVEALESIGASKAAAICSDAIVAAFPGGLPEAEAIRLAAANFSEEIRAKLDVLDQNFFKYPDNLTELLFVYVSAHPDEFGKLPLPDSE
jgi:hypothetical protein